MIDVGDELATSQTLTASGATTNHKNLRMAGRHIGLGKPMVALITLRSAPVATGTYSAKLQVDDATGWPSATDLAHSVTISPTAPAGKQYVIPIPPDTSMEKFIRGYLTLGGTTPSITFDMHIVAADAVPAWTSYADAREFA